MCVQRKLRGQRAGATHGVTCLPITWVGAVAAPGRGAFASAGWLAGGGYQGMLPSCQQMAAGSVTPCGDSRAAGQCCEIKRSIGALFLWGEEATVMRTASGRPCTALCHRQRHKARWARSRYLPVWQAVSRRDVLCFFCSKKVPKIGTSFTMHFGTENYSWLH